jgi:hypothetical protein
MAKAIRDAAGWAETAKNGPAEFFLAGEISFKLARISDRLAVLSSDLGPWPQDEAEADRLARRLAKLSAGAFGKRSSIVSASNARYELHLPFDPVLTGLDGIPRLCASFLNDLDWWRLNANR